MEERRNNNSRRIRRNERKALHCFAVLSVCVIVVISIVYLFFYHNIRQYDSKIIVQGVSVGKTDVSGLTAKKAAEKVEKDLSDYEDSKIEFQLDDGRKVSVNLKDLKLTVSNLDKVIQHAVDYGKTDNVVNNFSILKKAERGKIKKNFPVTYTVDKKTAEACLKKAFKEVLKLPENADLMADSTGSVTIVKEVPGEVLDMDKTIKYVERFLNDQWEGQSGTVKAVLSDSEAEITAGDLKNMTDLLGTYTTFYGSDGSGKAQNIEVGTELISDVILNPGEEFSVSEKMGPNTIENGFAEANSYEGNEVVTSVGGGVCQVATTLYNAVLLAELEVTERAPHSMTVAYVEPSMDAAIAENLLDFKFKNNQKSAVYIQGVLKDGNVTFNIYGKERRSPDRRIEYISEVTDEQLPEGKRYQATDAAVGEMYTVAGATPSISAQLIKVVYENEVEVSREAVNYSEYMANKETIGVGTYSTDEAVTAKMKSAVDSQNEDLIRQTIAELTGEG